MNVPKIKGSHTAMKSGMIAAECVLDVLTGDNKAEGISEVAVYDTALRSSWIYDELRAVRNIRPAFRHGLWFGMAYSALDTFVFRGRAPWTLRQHADHGTLQKAADAPKIDYPKPDGEITFDKPSSVFLSNTNHEEDQPVHLRLKNDAVAIQVNLADYNAPEERYCPAGVYEILRNDGGTNPRLQINAQNCVHCKTCDIKDPTQNIDWTVPEGGGGPNYPNM